MLGRDAILEALELLHQRRASLAGFGEVAGRQKQTGSPVTQHEVGVGLGALELGQRYRILFRRRDVTVFQDLASVLAGLVGATHVLAETAVLELHLAATAVTLDARPFVALELELALLDLVAIAIGVATTDVQLAAVVNDVGIHRGATDTAAVLGTQRFGFRLFAIGGGDKLVGRDQVDGLLAALFRRQRIAGATEEDTGGGGTDTHLAAAIRAIDIGQHHLVGTHAPLFRRLVRFLQLLGKLGIEGIQHLLPLQAPLGDAIELVFHLGGELVVHQLDEVLNQTVGDNLTHLLGEETATIDPHIPTIDDGGDDGGVGRRTTDAAFFQLAHQRRFGEACGRLGEVLARIQFDQFQNLADSHCRQLAVFTLAAHRRQRLGPTGEAQGTATGLELELTCLDGQGGGVVLGRGHLAGHELTPDEVVQAHRIRFHPFQHFGSHLHAGGADRFVGLLGIGLGTVEVRLGRQVGCAILLADVFPHRLNRLFAEVGGVGTHIGDVTRFIETLGHHHGLLDPEAQTG